MQPSLCFFDMSVNEFPTNTLTQSTNIYEYIPYAVLYFLKTAKMSAEVMSRQNQILILYLGNYVSISPMLCIYMILMKGVVCASMCVFLRVRTLPSIVLYDRDQRTEPPERKLK